MKNKDQKIIDKRTTFELVLKDTEIDSKGNVVFKNVKSQKFNNGNDMYHWAMTEKPMIFKVKRPKKKK